MHAAWSDGVLALCLLLRGRLVHCERLLRTSELDSLEACAHALVDVTIALVHFAETEQEGWPRLGFYDYGSTMGLYAPGLDALVRFISGPLLATSEARPGFSAASTRLLTSVRALPDKHPRRLYNFDVLARLGLGYEDVKQIRPDIVYVSSSGFGQTGPYKDRPACKCKLCCRLLKGKSRG